MVNVFALMDFILILKIQSTAKHVMEIAIVVLLKIFAPVVFKMLILLMANANVLKVFSLIIKEIN